MRVGVTRALAFVGCFGSFAAHVQSQDQLQYSVTYRDQYSGSCQDKNNAYNSAWGANPKPGDGISCHYDGDNDVLPNIDFQVEDGRYAQGVSSERNGLQIDVKYTNGDSLTQISGFVKPTLQENSAGIGKPVYGCSSNPSERCGQGGSNYATSGPDQFQAWYNDNRKTNRRVGGQLTLDKQNDGTYVYSDTSFFPIDGSGSPPQNADDALVWHKATNNNFLFTTEIHTHFEYSGQEVFTFVGDDDVFVFINDRLAIDIGGFHPSVTATVDLSLPQNRDKLGLQVGETYSLDLFHAERHTPESNFRIQTTLVSACNVRDSGTDSLDHSAKMVTSRNVVATPDNIPLTAFGDSSYAFFPIQQNVASGFVATFKATVNENANGFVFVLQGRENQLNDLTTGAGGHLGLRYYDNAVAVVFDFKNYLASGGVPEIRLHKTSPENPQLDLTKTNTRSKFDQLIHPLNRGRAFEVRVEYLKNPAWFEVYIDNSLYLLDKDFDASILGGSDAYVGFTASKGNGAQGETDVLIEDWKVDTVAVELSKTKISGPTEPVQVEADGESAADIKIKTVDACDLDVTNGGLKHLLLASAELSEGRRLAEANETVVIVDNLDGTYSARFVFDTVGSYDVYLAFGSECGADPKTAVAGENCWVTSVKDAIKVVPETTRAPTETPSNIVNGGGLSDEAATGLGVSLSILFVIGCGAFYVMTKKYRNKWYNDREFIELGKRAALGDLEDDDDDDETRQLKQQWLETREELLKEQALGHRADQSEQVEKLQEDMMTITEHLRMLKKDKQEKRTSVNRMSFRFPRISVKRRQFNPVVTDNNGEVMESRNPSHHSYKKSDEIDEGSVGGDEVQIAVPLETGNLEALENPFAKGPPPDDVDV